MSFIRYSQIYPILTYSFFALHYMLCNSYVDYLYKLEIFSKLK